MINYFRANLLTSPERLIAHGCNAQGVMGSGIAKAIRDKWPECYETYRMVYERNGLQLGSVVMWSSQTQSLEDGRPAISVANCITQNMFGRTGKRYVDYDAVETSIQKTVAIAKVVGYKSIGIPLIGAGLGGGDWYVIEDRLAPISDTYDIDINVYILEQELYDKYSRGRASRT